MNAKVLTAFLLLALLIFCFGMAGLRITSRQSKDLRELRDSVTDIGVRVDRLEDNLKQLGGSMSARDREAMRIVPQLDRLGSDLERVRRELGLLVEASAGPQPSDAATPENGDEGTQEPPQQDPPMQDAEPKDAEPKVVEPKKGEDGNREGGE